MTGTYSFNNQAVETQMTLAVIWWDKKRFQQAIASYEKAIQLQSNYIPAYLKLGQLFIQTNQIDQAIDVYRRAVELNASEPWLPAVLEHLLIQKGDFTNQETQGGQALEQYRAAVQRRSVVQRHSVAKPPHILIYTDCPGTYGAEQVSHSLMCELARLGYRVTCTQSRADHHLIHTREALGIKHVWLKGDARQFLYAASNITEVADLFCDVLPDLIIFADGGPASNLAANWLAGKLGIPYIRVVHCVYPDRDRQFSAYWYLLPDIHKTARAVVLVSQDNLRLMQEVFELPEQCGQVIYNGRSADYFSASSPDGRDRLRHSLGIPQDAVVIFTAARIDTVKGYQHQLSAIEQLKHSAIWPRLYFVWAGTGHIEALLNETIEQLGVGNQIKWLGERSDIPNLLEAADIFLLPSHAEGMPLAVMEAMAKGLPVMATAISGIPEELGETGKLLPDPNINSQATVHAIVDTIQDWAIDSELRQAVGQACQQRAAAMFREEQMLEAYLALIQRVLEALSE